MKDLKELLFFWGYKGSMVYPFNSFSRGAKQYTVFGAVVGLSFFGLEVNLGGI